MSDDDVIMSLDEDAFFTDPAAQRLYAIQLILLQTQHMTPDAKELAFKATQAVIKTIDKKAGLQVVD